MNYTEKVNLVTAEVGRVILGKQETIDKIMLAILAEGHILIEDIPGVGKTTMALAFARAMDMEQKRVQFTPDVLPSDITGFSLYRKETERFEYQPGAVLCNLFLADEINRTSAKTQSALLEVMEEGSVTVDGVTREVPQPFVVIATENPVGSAGTHMLPESQLDRFMICVKMGYPNREDEMRILMEQSGRKTLNSVRPVISRQELQHMQDEVRSVFIHEDVFSYIVSLSEQTRSHPKLELGLSPRGSLAVAGLVRAQAYMQGRDYAIPDDVTAVFPDAVRHRLRISAQARMERVSAADIVEDILRNTDKPRPEKKKR